MTGFWGALKRNNPTLKMNSFQIIGGGKEDTAIICNDKSFKGDQNGSTVGAASAFEKKGLMFCS